MAKAASAESIQIEITRGAIKNGYLPLRDKISFFGEKDGQAVKEVCLEIEGLGTVRTSVDQEKKIFRWRGWKRFFAAHGLRVGDAVTFTKTAEGAFHVSPKYVSLLPDEGRQVSHQLVRPSLAGKQKSAPSRKKCNRLDGKTWLEYSISVWDDIKRTVDEVTLAHPAMFPQELVERLLDCFTGPEDRYVLDPFMGSGSTLVAACNRGMHGIGLEIVPDYIRLAKKRLSDGLLTAPSKGEYTIHQVDARKLLEVVAPESVDFCLTSPPYWDILNRQRTADRKNVRNYGNLKDDLSLIPDYHQFLEALGDIFAQVLQTLKPKKYCCVVVMDLRKKNKFYPFHSDLANVLVSRGFSFEDIIIWNRKHEYNNLRPLGYPYTFRVNKVHEYILIFRKPTN